MNDRPVKRRVPDWPEEGGRHFEGDIVLTGDQAEQILDGLQKSKRLGRPRVKRKFIGSRVGEICELSMAFADSPLGR